jgi:hypothetical protein
MTTEVRGRATNSVTAFPKTEIEHRLRAELDQVAQDAEVTRPDWEPLLDSQRVVSTVVVLEDLFTFKLPPDRVVKKGGYTSVDEALRDMVSRIERIAARAQKNKESK